MKRHSPTLNASGCVLALLAVFLFLNRAFLLGRVFPIHDADGFFAPFFMFVADLARQGELLTWNPFNNAGSPDFADPQVGALCPVILSFGLVFGDTLQAFILYFLSIWGVGGVFMLMLARHIGAPLWAAFAIALAFLFSGFFVGHGQHVSFMRAYAFLPGLLWRLDVGLRSGRLRAFAEAGLCLGLSALGGYPAIVLLNVCFGMAWVLFSLVFGPLPLADVRAPRVSLARTGLGGLCLSGIGALVMVGTYAAFFLAAAGYTDRVGGIPRDVAVESGALHPRGLATFASPWLATAPQKLNWEYTDISSVSVYIGAFVTLLAVIALLLRPRSLWRWGLFVCAGVAILAALGKTVPVRGWLYDLLPPFRYFRHASAFRGYAIFSFCLLAALAAGDLARAIVPLPRFRASRVFAIVLASIVVLPLVRWGFGVVVVPPDHRWVRYAAFNAGCLWVGTAAALLLWSIWPQRRWVVGVVAVAVVSLAIADASLCYTYGQSTLRHEREDIGQQWAALESRRVRTLDGLKAHGLSRDRISNDAIGLGPGLTSKNLLLRVPVLYGYSVLTNSHHLSLHPDPVLSRTVTASRPDRFWFSPSVYEAPLTDQAVYRQRVVAHGGDLPLVVHETGALKSAGVIHASTPATRVLVQPRVYEPGRLQLDFDAPDDGWLLITERWAPYWRATVNGVETPIVRGNFIFRLLPVRKGENTIDMRYHPEPFLWLGRLGWLTVAAMLMWMLVPPARRLLLGWRTSRISGAPVVPSTQAG